MTSQQQADALLLAWQANRHLPPSERLSEIRTAAAGDPHVLEQFEVHLAAVACEMELSE